MKEEHEVDHSTAEKYPGRYVIQEDEADKWDCSQNSKLRQSDTIEYGLEVHVRLGQDASAQHDNCVANQVEVHVLGVALEDDVVGQCELEHREDEYGEVKFY